MASRTLKNIFLSASIPFKERHPKYFDTADIIAIRDAVIALSTVVLPKCNLIWGGHPSITPLIYQVMDRIDINIQEHVKLYQSKYYEHLFPADNNKFQNVILTENTGDDKTSKLLMRKRMLEDNKFSAGIFIGGMEGVEEEYAMYIDLYPDTLFLPIASTGAAAKIIFDHQLNKKLKNVRLQNDYAYMSLFQDLLIDKL